MNKKRIGLLFVTALLTSILAITEKGIAQNSSLPGDFYNRVPYLEQPVNSKQLENKGVWRAPHLLVGGSDAYVNGEYIYQDFIYDDHGAANPTAAALYQAKFHAPSGGITYPTNDERYGRNAGDLFEFRVTTDKEFLYYRVSFTTMKEEDASVVTIGIDTKDDPSLTVKEWPHQANFSQDLGIDTYVTAWGTGGTITTKNGEHDISDIGGNVSVDIVRNQKEIKIPKSSLPFDGQSWKHWVGTGIWDGNQYIGVLPIADQNHLGGGTSLVTPSLLNVAFRFDESIIKGVNTAGITGAGYFREYDQALALRDLDIEKFHQTIDFTKLANRVTKEMNVPKTGVINRIFASRYEHGEGVQGDFPQFMGQLQQYMVYIPEQHSPSARTPLALWLHSLNSGANQYAVGNPNLLRILGEKHGFIVATAMARGFDGWYWDSAQLDVFEMWEDIANNYQLDPSRTIIGGYSMGGYAAYKFGAGFPDWFSRAFSIVGPAGVTPGNPPIGDSQKRTSTYHLVENYRNLPFYIQHGTFDELVPVTGVTAQYNRFIDLGYQVKYALFPGQDHFTFSILDEWKLVDEELKQPLVINTSPRRVTFKYFPAHDNRALGITQNKAYWIDELELANTSASLPEGMVDAISRAVPEGDPLLIPIVGSGVDGSPYVLSGQQWAKPATSILTVNELSLKLDNIKNVKVDATRAQLDTNSLASLKVNTDHPVTIHVTGYQQVRSVLVNSLPVPYELNRKERILTFNLPKGNHSVVIAVK